MPRRNLDDLNPEGDIRTVDWADEANETAVPGDPLPPDGQVPKPPKEDLSDDEHAPIKDEASKRKQEDWAEERKAAQEAEAEARKKEAEEGGPKPFGYDDGRSTDSVTLRKVDSDKTRSRSTRRDKEEDGK